MAPSAPLTPLASNSRPGVVLMPEPKRVHFTGGPGGGKTTAARQLAQARGAPWYDLDGMLLEMEGRLPVLQAIEEVAARLPSIALQPAWVSDGAYLGWAQPLLDAADLIVWIDLPPRVALFRILARHLKADLRRDNRFPGWRRLMRFWRWCLRYYRDGNPPGINVYGTPETRAHTAAALRSYEGKLRVCRSNKDLAALLEELTRRAEG